MAAARGLGAKGFLVMRFGGEDVGHAFHHGDAPGQFERDHLGADGALMGALMAALMGAARGERPNVAARRRVSDGAVSAVQALHAPVIREEIGGISVWVPMMYDLAGHKLEPGHKLEQGVQGRFRGAGG